MPRLVNRLPSLRLHKADGRAVVTLGGRDIFLGTYGTPESRAEYDRQIAIYVAAGRRRPAPATNDPAELSVNELLVVAWRHFQEYYRRPDGSPAPELDNLRLAVRPLKELFGCTRAAEFDARALKILRQHLVDSGLCRRTVNQRIARVVRVFRFGAEEKLIPGAVFQDLKAVPGLRAGRSRARESRKVKPVPDEHVEAVLPYLCRQLGAVVTLQRLTGMRSGEALAMRTCDVDVSGDVWVYTPARHKTEHHGRSRPIYLGPQAQAALRPWLRADPSAYLFQPREAMEEYLAARRRGRRTPRTPSQRARVRAAEPRRAPGDRYDTRTYNHAIGRACARAGVPRWFPHQLRHSAATKLRREFGLEVARVILGHSSPNVTETYAAVDQEKAIAAVQRMG
jgi:integrase